MVSHIWWYIQDTADERRTQAKQVETESLKETIQLTCILAAQKPVINSKKQKMPYFKVKYFGLRISHSKIVCNVIR